MSKTGRKEKEFYEMLDSCQGVILGICFLFSDRGTAEADDLYQEILLSLWEGFHTFRHESDMKTWVYKVALNTARMHRRNQMHERKMVVGSISEKLCDSLAEEQGDEQIAILYSLIDRLDEEEKQIVYLYIDRMKVKQIASVVGKSEGAVKQIIRRIKIKLRMLYEKEKDNDR